MLEYFALGMLLLTLTAIFYIFIYIHDLPHMMAKKRNHPQVEAIHYACWLSLFTLHAIWPFVFLWAVSNSGPMLPPKAGADAKGPTGEPDELADLKKQVQQLQTRLAAVEKTGPANIDAKGT